MACSNVSSFLLFFLILNSTHLRFKAYGRTDPVFPASTKRWINEERYVMKSQIGSRPPSCERRCRSCSHCEAVQVPTNPQPSQTKLHAESAFVNLDYARGDGGSSNYKPLSWKCKCGNTIFNP